MEVGQFVRTKYGISQYKQHKVIGSEDIKGILCKDGSRVIFANIEDIIGEPSFKIEELLRIGDYVNGYMINDFDNEYYDEELDDYVEGFSIVLGNEEQMYSIPPKDIKTVLTKEQMEAMQYKVV